MSLEIVWNKKTKEVGEQVRFEVRKWVVVVELTSCLLDFVRSYKERKVEMDKYDPLPLRCEE